jgi:outer membrane protein TolC
VTLETFLSSVKTRNLDIQIETAKANAADAKSIGISLPPPTVGFIQMDMQDGSSAKGLEVSQMVPFPTKLTSDRSARNYEALAQKELSAAQTNETLALAKLTYVSLWLTQERLKTLVEKKSIIDQHINLSTSAVRSDNFLKLHVLKAESDRDMLENEIESLRAVILEKQLLLAQFVYEDLNTFKPTLAEPPLSAVPNKNIFQSSPQIETARLTYESLKARETESKSSWLPDFELRYKQMEETSMSPSYKEYMIGVTVPFAFFWEPYSAAKSAKAESLGAELEYRNQKQKVESEVATLLAKADSLKKQLTTLREKLLPRAERRMKIAHNLAPRDMETLQDHRETMEAFPDLKLENLELREQYEKAVAELEKFAKRNSP